MSNRQSASTHHARLGCRYIATSERQANEVVEGETWYPDRYWRCQRKKKYSKRVAHRIAKKRTKQGLTLEEYPCPYCYGWHVGKPPKWRR